MGVIEILTIVLVTLKLLGVIAWSWQTILLPEYVTIVLYINWILLQFYRWRRERKRRKRTKPQRA